MRIANEHITTELHPQLQGELEEYRRQRRFNPQDLVSYKATLLNDYMRKHGLKACVIGVSGGIDSAVALQLLDSAANYPSTDSPIEKIVALSLPALGTDAVTRQADAWVLANKAVEGLSDKVEFGLVDLKGMLDLAVDKTFKATRLNSSKWSQGQLVPCLRTPILYYTASLLADAGLPALVIGTINRDEGAYMGYVGKASDGMVDLQLISDLHKSEVRQLASHFGVHEDIRNAAPSPDMFDGRTDEEVFGAPYDFVELYLNELVAGHAPNGPGRHRGWCGAAVIQYMMLQENVEKIHAYNAHKYLVGSPAIHLDVYESAVPGGWEKAPELPQNTKFVNAVDAKLDLSGWRQHDPRTQRVGASRDADTEVYGGNIFTGSEIDAIRDAVGDFIMVPADRNGFQLPVPCAVKDIGSWRLSWHNQELANLIWNRIKSGVPRLKYCNEWGHVDYDDTRVWRPVGVSPLLRFIQYDGDANTLLPHYDAPYIYGPNRRTMQSIVINMNEEAGPSPAPTRFLRDPQHQMEFSERDFSDWDRPPTPEEIDFVLTTYKGDGIIFDHRLLHDSAKVPEGKTKLIMRTDIVYERCGVRG